ncbi:MAG TPA: tetratricopeptide repeat protein, partial [Candidatus Acidoferrales bacterium]|nr:tetratricopeptide repeat protein [Candidatus Acidoferrales bacterium]
GQERKAEREFARALSITPHNADIMAALARAYARDGQPSLAVGLMAELRAMKPVPAYDMALVEDAIGARAAAVQWLTAAQAEHDANMTEFDLDPRMDGLRRNVSRLPETNA